ncbi:hypothetical protein [Ktedonospora formicarum]|uniref:hypothetical protein n=1 Tax=Ktedonospora formicarum TaxID=2778364 RepID=UPI001C68FAD6|nr:hypothetical protein [Ktedonospora formicarum]
MRTEEPQAPRHMARATLPKIQSETMGTVDLLEKRLTTTSSIVCIPRERCGKQPFYDGGASRREAITDERMA